MDLNWKRFTSIFVNSVSAIPNRKLFWPPLFSSSDRCDIRKFNCNLLLADRYSWTNINPSRRRLYFPRCTTLLDLWHILWYRVIMDAPSTNEGYPVTVTHIARAPRHRYPHLRTLLKLKDRWILIYLIRKVWIRRNIFFLGHIVPVIIKWETRNCQKVRNVTYSDSWL